METSPARNLPNPNSRKSACPFLKHLTLGLSNDGLCWVLQGFSWLHLCLGHLGIENEKGSLRGLCHFTASPAADSESGRYDQVRVIVNTLSDYMWSAHSTEFTMGHAAAQGQPSSLKKKKKKGWSPWLVRPPCDLSPASALSYLPFCPFAMI